MNRLLALFLKICVVLFGLGVLAFLLVEPQLEGRNAHATTFEIYFRDPFLAYAYIASIPFFMALFRAFQWLGYAGRNEEFSAPARNAMKSVKRCGISLIVFALGGLLIILVQESDDRSGGVMMGLLGLLMAVMITVMSMIMEIIVQ